MINAVVLGTTNAMECVMLSEGAVSGIRRFGSGWKFDGPRISPYTKIVGEFIKKKQDYTHEDVREYLSAIKVISTLVTKYYDHIGKGKSEIYKEMYESYESSYLPEMLYDISNISASDVEDDYENTTSEVAATLHHVFDEFDYYRVLVR